MQRLKNLLRSALNFGKAKIGARVDKINAGFGEENVPQVLLNVIALVLPFGISLFAGIVLVRFVIQNLHLFIIGAFLAAALYSAVLKFLGVDVDDGNGEDSISIELAEQEAEEVHEDLLNLMYNAIADTSEHMPIQRPRDEYSIETSRKKSYWMEGSMAVHQFEVDCDSMIDPPTRDNLIRELQRHINQQSRRYPGLMRDGHPPVVYDIKRHNNFLLIEVVLHYKNHSKKIEDRKRARIKRRHGQERIDDPRYQ
ncbi:MAG: hypothetical protein HDT35_08625 [Clostridiales bacterium]|nr:hypothetical protein [Clostridiales bacterium]